MYANKFQKKHKNTKKSGAKRIFFKEKRAGACVCEKFFVILQANMKKILLIFCVLLCPYVAKADARETLLTDLLNGAYNAETMSEAEMDSVLNVNDNDNQRYRLECENREQVYRHSYWADWYLVDTQKKTRTLLGGGKTRDAQLSPNGKYVVYGKEDKNLYIYKVDFKTEVPITHDGYDPLDETVYVGSHVYNGMSDWLYEEEFGITRMFWFSPDSKQVAFVRLTTKMQQTPLYGGTKDGVEYVPYVCAGGENPQAEACVYDIYYKSVKTMQIDYEDAYIPRLRWFLPQQPANSKTPVEAELMVLRLNRDQNEMSVLECNAKSTVAKLLYQEKQKNYYTDYAQFDEWHWLSDGKFLVVSEQGDYRQVYLYGANGQQMRCLTPELRDVTAVYGLDEKNGLLYYQAAPTPETRQAYVTNIKKNVTTQLTEGEGVHDLRFSSDYTKYIDCYQSVTTPNLYTLYTAAGKKIKELKNNNELKQRWEALGLPEMEFGTFTTERGDELHYWLLGAGSSSNTGGQPVVMTQYSGPGSQRVLNRWRKRWDYYLACIGYKVVCCDPRGTDARGKAWRAETYMNLGRKEAEDQISFARYVSTWPNVLADDIAMIGWSYGGFQVLRTMAEPAAHGLIKAGVAIAPVTDWRLYDSAYTERYMRRPQVNEGGYEAADLKKMAKDIEGKLLIVHGLSDDNVHARHTMLMVEALVDADKDFEMMVYPDDNHFLKKGKHYEHLHRKLLQYLETF